MEFTPEELAMIDQIEAMEASQAKPLEQKPTVKPSIPASSDMYAQGHQQGRDMAKSLGIDFDLEVPRVLKDAAVGISQTFQSRAPTQAKPKFQDGERRPGPGGVMMVRRGGLWVEDK